MFKSSNICRKTAPHSLATAVTALLVGAQCSRTLPSSSVHTDSCRLHTHLVRLCRRCPRHCQRLLPEVSIYSRLSLSPLLPLPSSSSIHIRSHTNIPRQLRQTALLASHPPYYAHALPQPTADETHCRPTQPTTHDKTRQQLLYHQSGYTAPLPSASLPTLRRCRGVAAARLRARFVGSPPGHKGQPDRSVFVF